MASIEEDVELCRKIYEENVKYNIEKKRYGLASLYMGNMLSLLERRKADLFYKIHWGVNYLSSAQMLEKVLSMAESKESIDSAVRIFEANQAQTKLPC